MKHFIIDGYNALFTIKSSLRKQYQSREGFVQYLRIAKPFGSERNRVTVVFDGRDNTLYRQKYSSVPVSIRYSDDKEADEIIVRMVKNAKRTSEIIVVTDDREIRERVSMMGAETLPVKEFFRSLTQKKKSHEEEKPDPTSKAGKQITEEMKKVWETEENETDSR